MIDCVNHQLTDWSVSLIENGQITYQKNMPGEHAPNEAAEWVACLLFEEYSLKEAEIMRFLVFRESTDEVFVFDVLCEPTVEYHASYIPDPKAKPTQYSNLLPDYKRLRHEGRGYAN